MYNNVICYCELCSCITDQLYFRTWQPWGTLGMAKGIIIHSKIRDSVFKKTFLWLKCFLYCSKLETGSTSSHIIKHHYVFMYGNSKSKAIPMPYPFKILISVWVLFWNVTFKGEGGKHGSTLRENDANSAWNRTAMGCSDFTNTIKGGSMWCLNPHSHFRPSSTLLGQRWSYLQGSI